MSDIVSSNLTGVFEVLTEIDEIVAASSAADGWTEEETSA